ncbi:hypothetical protein QQF64_024317 [Cirrhinus molitorella]|uniref:Uncharacterized protein n=1 Tax=Cirrhinus molitorella TaxID=172907 RepID=A0ABR3NL29_9TELE
MIFSSSTASSRRQRDKTWMEIKTPRPPLSPALPPPFLFHPPTTKAEESGTGEKETDKQRKGESSEQAEHTSAGGSKGFGSLGCQFAALMKASGRDTTPVQVSQEISSSSSSSSSPLCSHALSGELSFRFTWPENMTTAMQHRQHFRSGRKGGSAAENDAFSCIRKAPFAFPDRKASSGQVGKG